MNIRYGKREHRGTLEESLKTKKYISEKTFQEMLKDYHYYCYDSRCNQILFINTKVQYTWLFMEILDERIFKNIIRDSKNYAMGNKK